jgi:uncharacterized protein (TIGR03083 family)
MDHLASLRSNGDALVAAARIAGPDAPIEHCPGWTMTRLVGHTAKVLQRTSLLVREGFDTPPGEERFANISRDEAVFDEFGEILDDAIVSLAEADPDGPSWNFTGRDQVNSFWTRRMAHEVEVHRWDAQLAAGGAIDRFTDEDAVDGIDEMLTVLMPMKSALTSSELTASFHLHCTDADGEWLTTFVDGTPTTVREHAKGDMAVRGPASALYAWSWNRIAAGTHGVEALGDTTLVERWASVVP